MTMINKMKKITKFTKTSGETGNMGIAEKFI